MTGDDEDEPARGLFTPLYWAAIGAGLALTLLGGAVGWLGPRWLAHGPHAHPPALTGPGPHGRGAGRSPPPA